MADAEVEATFTKFWEAIVAPGGRWDLNQVKKELHDYTQLLMSVPQVYSHVTGGMISKPHTSPEAVIAEHDEHCPRFTRAGTDAAWELLEQAADEGRNVQPEDEEWTDDQAHAVEVFAARLLVVLDD